MSLILFFFLFFLIKCYNQTENEPQTMNFQLKKKNKTIFLFGNTKQGIKMLFSHITAGTSVSVCVSVCIHDKGAAVISDLHIFPQSNTNQLQLLRAGVNPKAIWKGQSSHHSPPEAAPFLGHRAGAWTLGWPCCC